MASIFSKIISGEIPAYKVAETNEFIAFLDVFPLAEGHTLVVPKAEIDNLFDLNDTHYTGLLLFSKKVAKAIKRSVECKKVGVAVVGLEVPHAHIHLIPINSVSDMNFANPKLKLPPEKMEAMAKKIRENMDR